MAKSNEPFLAVDLFNKTTVFDILYKIEMLYKKICLVLSKVNNKCRKI